MKLAQQLEMMEFKRYRGGQMTKRNSSAFDDAASEQELNLVAMMDVLTILLIFLLKSYSVSAMSIPVGEDKLSVPISTHEINPKEAVKLTITQLGNESSMIAVEDEAVVTLTPEMVQKLRNDSQKRNYLIKDLHQALLKRANAIKDMSELNPDIVFDHKIMVIADKNTPYWLITSILFSSAEAGFDQYNLVALRKDQG